MLFVKRNNYFIVRNFMHNSFNLLFNLSIFTLDFKLVFLSFEIFQLYLQEKIFLICFQYHHLHFHWSFRIFFKICFTTILFWLNGQEFFHKYQLIQNLFSFLWEPYPFFIILWNCIAITFLHLIKFPPIFLNQEDN